MFTPKKSKASSELRRKDESIRDLRRKPKQHSTQVTQIASVPDRSYTVSSNKQSEKIAIPTLNHTEEDVSLEQLECFELGGPCTLDQPTQLDELNRGDNSFEEPTHYELEESRNYIQPAQLKELQSSEKLRGDEKLKNAARAMAKNLRSAKEARPRVQLEEEESAINLITVRDDIYYKIGLELASAKIDKKMWRPKYDDENIHINRTINRMMADRKFKEYVNIRIQKSIDALLAAGKRIVL